MSAVGILCEYNPFHRGHQYVMDQARKKSGADGIVLVMSGDWVQRGEPAFFSKYSICVISSRLIIAPSEIAF